MDSVLPAATVWPVMLHGTGGRARVHPWAHDRGVAHLMFVDDADVPSTSTVVVWLDELRARGFHAVRTGAVTDSGAVALARLGFEQLQHLRLLDVHLAGWSAPAGPRQRTRRMRGGEREAAAAIDHAAFGPGWSMDVATLDDTRSATPVHRARVVGPARELAGFAISGRADRTGYLQRLAVDPARQGRGFGYSLTRDSLHWMQRRGMARAIVNTQDDNVAALALYRRVGFRVMPHGLAVMGRSLTR